MNSEFYRSLSILLPSEAEAVEIYAAEELRKYLLQIHEIAASIVSRDADSFDGPTIVLGDPSRHPALADEGLVASVPSVDGFSIRTSKLNPSILMITGDNGRGTLFGVYELVESWGVLFLLSGDVLPENPKPLRLDGFDLRRESAYPFRAVRPMANLPEGSAAWSLREFTEFIDQMARMKFNAFVFVIMESGPWLDYEFRGMERPAGNIFYGYRFPIDEGFIGSELFGGASEYYSPELGEAKDESERKQLGIGLVRAIIQHCKHRGLLSVLTFSFLEPPTAMKHAINDWTELELPDPESFKNAHFMTTPAEEFGLNPKYAAWMNVLDPVVQELIALRLRALIDTYQDADYYHLWVSEHRASVVESQSILAELDQKYQLKPAFDFEDEITRPGTAPHPERFANHMRGDLLFLYAFDKILNEAALLERTAKPAASLGIGGVISRLAPVATKVMPHGAVSAQFLDYGAHGPAERVENLFPLLDAGIPTTLEIGIHDDNDMYFPQANVESLESIVQATAGRGMLGYVVALWQVRQADINAAYLGMASWRPDISAAGFYGEYLPQLVGVEASEEFELGYRALEVADRYVRKGLLYGLAFPMTDGLVKALVRHGFDMPSIASGKELFQNALDHFERAEGQATPRHFGLVSFWRSRTRLAVEWMEMTRECHELGKILGAEIEPDSLLTQLQKDDAMRLLESLVSRVEGMIQSVVNDARHKGDLGQIANMNTHVLKCLRELRADISGRSCRAEALN